MELGCVFWGPRSISSIRSVLRWQNDVEQTEYLTRKWKGEWMSQGERPLFFGITSEKSTTRKVAAGTIVKDLPVSPFTVATTMFDFSTSLGPSF